MRRLTAVLVLLFTFAVGGTAQAGDRIFWSGTGSTIWVGNLDGSGTPAAFNTIGVTPSASNGLAIDTVRRRLVFTDQNNSTWGYARLDGSGGGLLPSPASTTLVNPTGLTIDSVDDRAYIANNNASSIVFAPLSGSGTDGTLATGATTDFVYGLTIDPLTRTLFSTAGQKIGRTQLPGGGGSNLTVVGATVSSPRGIAIDPVTSTLWWTNAGTNTISHAKFDGSAGGNLSTTGATLNDPRGVAIDVVGRRIYWANNNTGSIDWAKLDGSGGGQLFPSTIQRRFVLIQLAPRPVSPPVVTGGSDAGSVLSCSDGSWLADASQAFMYAAPASFAYQWSLDGGDIVGATASSYTASQAGSYRCRVTASNEAGNASQTSDAHAVNAVSAPPGTAPTPTPPAPSPALPVATLTAPVLSELKQTNKVFKPAKASTPLTGKTSVKVKTGTVFSVRLDKVASLAIVVRAKHGRKSTKVATLKRTARAGVNKIPFTGRIRRRALKPGTYSATFTATNSAGSSPARSISFKIVRR